MSKFKICIYPASRSYGCVSIAITNRIKSVVVECKLDQLRSEMEKAAVGIKSTMADMPLLNMSAYPEGRAPNGFKAFEASRQNQMTIEPIPAEPVVESTETAETAV